MDKQSAINAMLRIKKHFYPRASGGGKTSITLLNRQKDCKEVLDYINSLEKGRNRTFPKISEVPPMPKVKPPKRKSDD